MGRPAPSPPARWRVLLKLFAPGEDLPFILSDLEEDYLRIVAEEGTGSARRWYRGQVARSILPFLFQRARRFKATLHGVLTLPARTSRAAMNSPIRSIGQALRGLRKAPLVAVITVVSLSLGIGASTAVFSVINAFLFQESEGLSHPEELVAIYTTNERGGAYGESSFPDYQDLADRTETLDGVAALRAGFLTFDPPPDAPATRTDRLIVEIVSGNYFQVLGIRPPLGRAFLPEETRLGSAHDVIVLSHEFWASRFDSDPAILGKALPLNGREFTVIGVAPPGLVSRLLRLKVQGWVPFGTPQGIWNATPLELASRRDHDCILVGRLKKGSSIEAAQSELTLLASHLHEAYPEAWTDDRGNPRTFTVIPERSSQLPPDARRAMAGLGLVMLAGAFFVLLLACSNVASLFLARAHRRRREMAIRLSLGASRTRVAGILLTESMILALLGGAGGLALAWWFAEFMASLPLPMDVPLAFDVGLDARVVIFTLIVSTGAAVLFGLAPALRASRPDLVPALKSDAGTDGRRPGRFGLRNLLVLGQVAAVLVLLIPAVLFFRSVQAGMHVDLGFNPDRVAVLWKTLEESEQTSEGAEQFFRALETRLEGLPEVENVEVATRADASVLDLADQAVLDIPGHLPVDGSPLIHSFSAITPGFLEMMETPIVRGRGFTDQDRAGAPAVVLVNEAFAERYFPESGGLGESFTILERREVDTPTAAPSVVVQVVGVVRDPPASLPGRNKGPFLWTPFFQETPSRAVIHIRGRTSAAAMVPILRREVPLAPGETPILPAQPYSDAIRGVFLGQEIASRLLTWAGLFALALALMGVYGVVSFSVTQRVREMAIRQALGARGTSVFRSLIWEGMYPTVWGTALGLALATGLAVMIRGVFFGVEPLDPIAMIAGTGFLLGSAFLATLIPARRALGADPMKVLREE